MTIFEKINQDIKEAMRSRDQIRLDTLRMLKSKILVVNARGDIPDNEAVKLIKTYFSNINEALEQARAANRGEIAQKLESELEVIKEFLPKAPSLEETKQLIIQAIADSGAKTKKDLGLVMKSLMKLNNAIDGKQAKDLANELLSD